MPGLAEEQFSHRAEGFSKIRRKAPKMLPLPWTKPPILKATDTWETNKGMLVCM
jgi:hypothetical protein